MVVQGPSSPLVTVSTPTPELFSLSHPKPCFSKGAPSGWGPSFSSRPFPCAFPKVCPPAVNAKVSTSFIPILAKVSLTSCADINGSGLAFGPSGFT